MTNIEENRLEEKNLRYHRKKTKKREGVRLSVTSSVLYVDGSFLNFSSFFSSFSSYLDNTVSISVQ